MHLTLFFFPYKKEPPAPPPAAHKYPPLHPLIPTRPSHIWLSHIWLLLKPGGNFVVCFTEQQDGNWSLWRKRGEGGRFPNDFTLGEESSAIYRGVTSPGKKRGKPRARPRAPSILTASKAGRLSSPGMHLLPQHFLSIVLPLTPPPPPSRFLSLSVPHLPHILLGLFSSRYITHINVNWSYARVRRGEWTSWSGAN